MSKFKVGDRVQVVKAYSSDASPLFKGDICTVVEVREQDRIRYDLLRDRDGRYDKGFAEDRLEHAEHPALTLAKAEVVRINEEFKNLHSNAAFLAVEMNAYTRVLQAFGLEYRAKPVVPQSVEYEFVPVQEGE